MTFEILVYCPTREMFVAGMTTTQLPDGRTLATLDDAGNLIPVEGVQMDEIGDIWKGETKIAGHHVNFRVYGELAKMLTQGLPQTDETGALLSLFDRTRILTLIPGLTWVPTTVAGVPEGYEGPNQVRLFDPAIIATRSRVWQ